MSSDNTYGFDSTALTVLNERYMHVKPDGSKEIVPEMFWRVASYLNKDRAQEYYEVMMNRDFLPNSPTLMNAGREGMAAQLSACYVLPIEDTMDGIYTALHHQAMIHKYGGGTGFNFSPLRPKGSRVNTTNGVASGPVSFMELFDISTEKVMQGGCFPAGSFVATVNGAMPIERLTAGTLVYSYDLEEGLITTPCTDAFMTRKNQPIWEMDVLITRKDFTCRIFTVRATPDHPFVSTLSSKENGYKYKPLYKMLPGDSIIPYGVRAEVIEVVDIGLTTDVWNVEVPGTHNFIVCDKEMTCGLVVKNTRRGANMGILNVDHPDILEFISCKADNSKRLNNFNISVGMNDEFMQKVENKTLNEYERKVWNAIIDCAWKNGDPGLVFFDEINRHNPTPELGELTATNPCGESPLLNFEACNLGSINLAHFITQGRDIDWARLEKVTRIAVNMLNDVIDVNRYPIPEVTEAVNLTRKIGLGVMGWADMLCKLGIKYGSKQSLELAEHVMSFIQNIGHDQSNGRNACVTCIAPTGSISLIAGCSSGIEPHFALEYDRVAFDKENRTILHYVNADYEEALINHDERLDNGVFVTAHEINYLEHIDMQAAFQKYVDLAVSKTINLPNSATKSDVERAYLYAWIKNCKGITVYR
ncbi:MAG: hypothetical protein IJ667_11680, partial [Synergistaceae bacterium]|nr:hypothetical protein [Synergistaceae bacterium]